MFGKKSAVERILALFQDPDKYVVRQRETDTGTQFTVSYTVDWYNSHSDQEKVEQLYRYMTRTKKAGFQTEFRLTADHPDKPEPVPWPHLICTPE
jgi:ribosomal protein S24E